MPERDKTISQRPAERECEVRSASSDCPADLRERLRRLEGEIRAIAAVAEAMVLSPGGALILEEGRAPHDVSEVLNILEARQFERGQLARRLSEAPGEEQ